MLRSGAERPAIRSMLFSSTSRPSQTYDFVPSLNNSRCPVRSMDASSPRPSLTGQAQSTLQAESIACTLSVTGGTRSPLSWSTLHSIPARSRSVATCTDRVTRIVPVTMALQLSGHCQSTRASRPNTPSSRSPTVPISTITTDLRPLLDRTEALTTRSSIPRDLVLHHPS